VAATAARAASAAGAAGTEGVRRQKSVFTWQMEPEEVLWEEIYWKLKDRDVGEVHKDNLSRALDLAGFSYPVSEWIEEIALQITHYSTLGQQEFFQFIEAYSRKQAEHYAAVFYGCDKDKARRLELPELPHIFDCINIDVMAHILRELFAEVCNGERSIDLKGFMKMMELYKLREGFSREEIEDFMRVFELFDVDGSDSIDASGFACMLSWLGFSWSNDYDFKRPSLKREVLEVYEAADTTKSGTLNQRELIICMRRMRSLEVEKISRVIRENAIPGSADRIHHDHLTRVLRVLGYTAPDRQAVFECAQDCCSGDVNSGLDMGQVWQVVAQYRNRHGFSAAVKAEIQAAFDACKSEHEADIDQMQVPLLLRQLGFALPLHVQRHITERVDVGCTSRIDLESAIRIVRRACEHGLARAQELFDLHKEDDPSGRAVISEEVALEVLDIMGLDAFDGGAAAGCLSPDDLAPSPRERRLTEEGFFRTYARLAEADRRRVQANGSFSSDELRALLDSFNHHDRDGTGIVRNQSLMKMLQRRFPEANDASFRPRLLELMAQVSPDGNGLDFAGFRRLSLLYVEMRERDVLLKESHTIRQTSFTLAEVAELRAVFLSTPGSPDVAKGARRLLSWSELKLLVLGRHQRQRSEGVPQGRGWGNALMAFLQQAMPERAGEDEKAQFDFNEFLVIMQAIADGKLASVL